MLVVRVRDVVQAGALVRVAHPDLRRVTLEQADAAAELRRALAVEGVVEAHARLDDEIAVDGVRVVVAEAAGPAAGDGIDRLRGGERGVVLRLRARVRTVGAQAEV